MKTIILAIISVLFLFSVKSQEQTIENLNSKQSFDLIQKNIGDTNFVILDVRTPLEFEEGHIENAILIDFKGVDFEANINKLNPEKTYLIYCKKGGRSAKAIEIMKKRGFDSIFHLFQGFDEWKAEGYPVLKNN